MSADAAIEIQDAEKRGRIIGRRLSDIALHESKLAHQLTANALVAAIMAIENGDRSENTLRLLREAAIRAEAFTQ